MKNNGLFSSIFIENLKERVALDDAAQGRMVTLAQTWHVRKTHDVESLWESFLKKALSYLEFVPSGRPDAPGVYQLYEDWGFTECVSVLYLAPPGSDIDDSTVGRFYPAKLIARLKERKLTWGILTDGSCWCLYSTKSSRPFEDYVELFLAETLEGSDEAEYGLFERFFHRDSFVADLPVEATAQAGEVEDTKETGSDKSAGIYKCRLDHDREQSEKVLEERVKKPFLAQVDEVLQYICNGFIFDTQKSGEEYTEKERAEIFESAVKLIYRCLFLFYAEARRLIPTDSDKADLYLRHSIQALCQEAHKFRWGKRRDTDQYDLWKHLKGLINAVNDGDPEYGIMGYNGGLFDDEEERFLGQHQLRNDFLYRALYLLAFVEPFDNEPDGEYLIPYSDLESSANPQEFFSIYDPKFRSLNRKQSLISLKKICDQNENIEEKWNLYQKSIAEQNIYFNEPSAYTSAPCGRNNLFQYFLLRGFDLLFIGGRMGIVVPSSIYTDQGCQPLREMFFNRSRIDFLYCFENRRAIFNIHRSFKFVLFGTQKGGSTDRFKCAFMEHDPELLPKIDDHAITMDLALIKELAPQELSIPEINEQRESDILVYLHVGRPNLGSIQKHSWNANIRIEFMSNTDAWRFKGYEKELVPVYTGGTFFQYDPDFSSPYGYMDLVHLQGVYGPATKPWNTYRIVYRDVAASTNERTCISTVIPPPNACVEMSRIVMLSDINEELGFALMSLFVGILNSFVLDFILRHIVTSHLSNNIMHRLPIERIAPSSYLGASIYSRVARLLCTDERFRELWGPQFSLKWGTPDFWYPSSAPIDAYGPAHEQDIRLRLRNEAPKLTPEWGPHCGVHDRLPDRRDTGDRAQLRAEIDAYVAHLYGLSRDDFAYIMDTFPVLKKKEKKAFGEFMSKRKCLEEYDRVEKTIAPGFDTL